MFSIPRPAIEFEDKTMHGKSTTNDWLIAYDENDPNRPDEEKSDDDGCRLSRKPTAYSRIADLTGMEVA